MLGWLHFCISISSIALLAAAGLPMAGPLQAQSMEPMDEVAAEAAASAAATRENVRGDETFQGAYTCLPPAGEADTAPIVCEGRINPLLPHFYFSLSWHLDEFGDRAVDRIEIRRKGEVEPFQIIEQAGSHAAAMIPNNGFELIDVNFDGYHDLRLIAEGAAGPNVLYRNWLWSEDDGRFVPNAALDEIVSPEFDPDTQEIVSHWRSSAAEGGVDIHAWEEGVPVLIHRETDEYAGPSSCTRTFYDRIDGELQQTGTGACG